MVHSFRLLLDNVLRGKQYFRGPGPGIRTYCLPAEEIKEVISTRVSKRVELRTFIDTLRIHVKGGTGGEGYPKGGGIGGKGGDVIIVGSSTKDLSLKTISKSNPGKKFHAKPGDKAKFFCMFGQPGASIKIPCPLGVSVISEHGRKIGEINSANDEVIIAKGGDGGSPLNGYCGQRGEKQTVTLDLKLIADVGFVGFPNAGKSTLLKAISGARPRIASYPFTTIRPNIGVIIYKRDQRHISLADLPGLIEGAHINMGMGHKFLKHVERTKVLLFVVDLHGFRLSPQHPARSALETIILLNKELELYQEDLALKPAILALNKTDKPGSYSIIENIRDTLKDDESFEKFVQTLPKEFRPNRRVIFDHILPISALHDPNSVLNLRNEIRECIDTNHSLKEIYRTRAFPDMG